MGGLIAGLLVGIPIYELLRRGVEKDIREGLLPPSIPAVHSDQYDFDELHASLESAIADQEEYQRRWDEATPAERKHL